VDNGVHPPDTSSMSCLLSTDAAQVGQTVNVEGKNGSAISITVPAAGFVIYH
jgi:hypothetical protein